MIKFKHLNFLLILFLFINVVRGQECENFNRKNKFKFLLLKEKGISVDTSLVKINGVYISEYSRINLDKKQETLYYFFRFFENGKVYMSGGYCSFPNELELNNVNYGFYGEYIIEGTKVIIESFGGYSGYFLKYFIIDNNNLTPTYISKRKLKGNVKLLPSSEYDGYKYYKCNLNSKSFW